MLAVFTKGVKTVPGVIPRVYEKVGGAIRRAADAPAAAGPAARNDSFPAPRRGHRAPPGDGQVERLHEDRYLGLKARGVPILFALWHGRMYLSIQAHRGQGIVTMASQSKDGEIIARWLERNGYVVVRGSTSKRGRTGAAGDGRARSAPAAHAALTVDGPRGPARVVQPGVVQLARLTGAWILPITSSSSRGALPRVPGTVSSSRVPSPGESSPTASRFRSRAELSDEAGLARIGAALDDATAEADAAAGIVPVSRQLEGHA